MRSGYRLKVDLNDKIIDRGETRRLKGSYFDEQQISICSLIIGVSFRRSVYKTLLRHRIGIEYVFFISFEAKLGKFDDQDELEERSRKIKEERNQDSVRIQQEKDNSRRPSNQIASVGLSIQDQTEF